MNFYEYLGLNQNASKDEIRKAFRKLAKQKHPDHNKKDTAFWDMVELNIVRDTLMNDSKRMEYSLSLYHDEISIKQKKRTTIFKTVKSLFTYHCKVCGIEMSSTWRGYCLQHYLEETGQIDNEDCIFEYGGRKYQWEGPPSDQEENHEDNHNENIATQAIKVQLWQIIIYTGFIVGISAYLVLVATQFMR